VGQGPAICIGIACRFLARRKRDLFLCDRMLRSLFMPLGTALGVFMIVLLSRESVKAVFNAAAAAATLAQ